jgi:hypothetical protein
MNHADACAQAAKVLAESRGPAAAPPTMVLADAREAAANEKRRRLEAEQRMQVLEAGHARTVDGIRREHGVRVSQLEGALVAAEKRVTYLETELATVKAKAV